MSQDESTTMRRIHILIILLLCCSLAGLPAMAAERIILFGYDNKPPLAWVENDTPKGIYLDILHQIEERTGLAFEIRLMPWKRAYMQALDKQGGIFGLSKNTERLRIFDYSEMMYVDEMRLVVLKGNEFEYRTVDDLEGKTIGVTRGASYGDVFDKASKTIFTPSVDANPVCRLRMLLAGRIDAALIGPGEASVRHVIEQDRELRMNRNRFVVLETPFNRDANFIGFNKALDRTGTLAEINQALEAMWLDGTIERIEAQY